MNELKGSIGIVIVNYNGATYQNECLRTIYNLKYDNIKIIIVDSGSTDNSLELVKGEFGYKDNIVILKQKNNCGVAKGNNIGIQYCIDNHLEYVMLLNNDVELDEKLLNNLLENIDENTIVVPKIYFYEPNNLLWYAGGDIDWKKGEPFHHGIHQFDNGQFNINKNINYAPTCCMLMKTKVFNKIGLVDEKVFMYYDDTDLCVRLIDNGFKLLYVPKAVMWHKVSSSTGGENSKVSIYYMSRNQLYFLDKHKDKCSFYTKYYVIIKGYVKAVLCNLRGKRNDKMIIQGYKDYFKKQMGRKDF